MIVDPAPGALVRDPVTKLALEPGADVDEHDPYWSRALADGDLVAAPAPAEGGRRRSTAHSNEAQ